MDETAESASRPSAEEARAWAGHRLDELGGAHVGRVDGVLVDDRTGEAEWLVARMGRFGHHTLVPVRDAVAGVEHVWVPYTRELIREAPRADANVQLTAAGERALLAHYGIVGAGRAAELDEREDDATTSRRP